MQQSLKIMKIAQVAPLFESVPPKLYGGTERVVSFLTEALVEMGQDVTLFATGDSSTSAHLVPIVPEALRLSKVIRDPYASHILQLQQVVEQAGRFDIIHFHTDYFHFPVSRLSGYSHITTLHGRLDLLELAPLYRKFCDIPLVSISHAQRIPLEVANFVSNVYHGIPENLFRQGPGAGNYAVVVGRFSPEKGIDKAIEISQKANIPIKIAAKVDAQDRDYFESEIKHLLELPHVEYLGEIDESQKQEVLGNAKVFLFPIDWPEPFGMVMIESMACGTPVVAYDQGSVREIISPGRSGYIVNNVDEAIAAVRNINNISRDDCRAEFMSRFEAKTMASNYLRVYEQVIRENEQIRLPFADGRQNKVYIDNMLSA
jgi:glycosyltransferase involved in cell wall biosynthesis